MGRVVKNWERPFFGGKTAGGSAHDSHLGCDAKNPLLFGEKGLARLLAMLLARLLARLGGLGGLARQGRASKPAKPRQST